MMEIFAYSHNGDKKVSAIDDEFDYLMVELYSGDEYIYAYKNGATGKHPAFAGCAFGGSGGYQQYESMYFVDRDELNEWLNRRSSYFWVYERRPHQKLETSE